MAEIDHTLRRQVAQVENLVVQVGRELQGVGAEVNAISTTQQQTQSDLAKLSADFFAFVQASERRDIVQRSETRIGVLQDQLEHEFGHYKVVRRTSVGLLQAFDIGLVTEDVVRNVSEELMIQTPRYWLAPALVALTAWAGDDRELATRAVAEAYRRSPSKTALLFTLILRRQGRIDSSARWLRTYLGAQDPRALGRDFAVILESVAVGAFGPGGRTTVEEVLGQWTEALSDPAAHDEQVARWRNEIESHRFPIAGGVFPALAATSPEWPALVKTLAGAEAHEPVLEKYRAIMGDAPAPHDRIEDALDDILDRLVAEYDNEELPIQRDLAYHNAVVERDGDVDGARELAENRTAALEETLDYLTIQTVSALAPEQIGVSRATQRIAIASCRPWFAQAHVETTGEYRSSLPSDVHVRFGGDHSTGATAFQLPEWTGSLSEGVPSLERSLVQHWDQHTANYLQSLAYPVKQKVIVPAIITGIAFLISLAINPLFGFFVLVVMGGIWALVIWNRYKTAERNRAQAERVLAEYKQESVVKLREAAAQLTDWGSRYKAADGRADEVRQFIDGLAQSGHAAITYERRAPIL